MSTIHSPNHLHHCTSHEAQDNVYPPHLSPELPSQTFHPSLIPVPGGIIGSAAGGSHYSGAKIYHRRSDIERASAGARDHLVELTEKRKQVLEDLKELYCCRPSLEIFSRSFSPDAVFEDPLTKCRGLQEIAAQFYAMPKVFSKSETIARRILSSTNNPNRIIYSQTQEYTIRVIGAKKKFKSIVVVDLDDDDKIVRLEDQWNGEELPTSWGLGSLRKFSGKATPWLVRVPKDLRKSI